MLPSQSSGLDLSEQSQEYHAAHLAFSRAAIVEAAANREPLLDRLHAYTADVVKAERDRRSGVVEAERQRDQAWKRVSEKAARIDALEAQNERLDREVVEVARELVEALGLIAEHARLDLSERGIAEAERYAVIAEDALRRAQHPRGGVR